MQVNIVIPVHNRIDVTMECLSCLEGQTYNNYKIIVVDDGSTDGTCERIKSKYEDVEILSGDGTLWWSGAMYLGVEHILTFAKDTDYILSLNNDTAFGRELIESLVRVSQHYGQAIVGSMEKNYYNREEILYLGEWLDWQTFKFIPEQRLPEKKNINVNEHVNVLPGRGMLIPVEVIKKIGNFNKVDFPHYISDYEFTMRAFNRGIRLLLSYDSVVYTRPDTTGISVRKGLEPLILKEAYVHLFSIKSTNNIFDFINFIKLHCPKKYKFKNILRLIVASIFDLKLMWPLRKLTVNYFK